MHRLHRRHGPFGLGGGPERGGGHEVGRALEAPPRVVAVVAVLGDAGHRQGVQRLQQQGAQPTHEHRAVGVHEPDRGVVGEPALARRVEELDPSFGDVLRPADHAGAHP